MIRVGILGDIGSGKSHIAKNFGYPVFNADSEVGELYKKDRKIFNKLKKVLPKYIYSFPVNKKEISNAILANKSNLKKIVKIVHLEIRKKMNIFIKKNINQKIVILDIPLLLENKINTKNDILVFVLSKKIDIFKRLKKRKNFNFTLYKKFKNIQLALDYKKKISQFVIKNNFTNKSINKSIKDILKEIL
jgi:dephospho-CoA kinase